LYRDVKPLLLKVGRNESHGKKGLKLRADVSAESVASVSSDGDEPSPISYERWNGV
jgi:hypothetical protein